MKYDKVSYNGRLIGPEEFPLNPLSMVGCNLAYTVVNTSAHQPLMLDRKLEVLAESYEAMFGTAVTLNPEEITREIGELLYYGLYPKVGNTLTIYLLPNGNNAPDRLIIHTDTTPYNAFTLLDVRPRANIARYEIPFERHHTTLSLAAARHADLMAKRYGYDLSVRANARGEISTSGDNTVMAIRGNTLIVPTTEQGARKSAEREAVMEAAQRANMQIIEGVIRVENIESYDEMWVVTPSGIVALYSLGTKLLMNICASRIARHL